MSEKYGSLKNKQLGVFYLHIKEIPEILGNFSGVGT